MPYFITDKSPDCSGWATIKEDGEVIGCHTTKQDAIDQMVDDDDQAEILDYFKNCETSSLDIAKSELADLDLEWEQLKIMRIKFLCDYGI